ncbi:MAG: hypothetical protein ACHQ53_00865, partial [Polyangiales bacterium]
MQRSPHPWPMPRPVLAAVTVVALALGCSNTKDAGANKPSAATPSAPGAAPGQPGLAPKPGVTAELDAAGGSPGSTGAGPVPDTCKGTSPYSAYVSDPQLCVYVFADRLGAPRDIAFSPNGDLFVNNGAVMVLWDDNHDGHSEVTERATFASASGLRHGLAFSRDGKL